MKGIVFTEFLEMVEDVFGWEIVEDIISESNLSNKGAYTAVGTYPHSELIALVVTLSKKTQIPAPELLKTYGRHLFAVFYKNYPHFFYNMESPFEFLLNVESYIHVEVRKLYPDAELPSFECTQTNPHELVMLYQSERPFADFAEGLIEGCIIHFGESIQISRVDIPSTNCTKAKFILLKQL